MVTMTTVEIPSSTAPTTTTKTASRTLTKVGCDVYYVYVEKNECDDDIDDEIDDNTLMIIGTTKQTLKY